MSKGLAKTTENAVVASENMDAWGNTQVDASNILIPKVLLMQGLSEMVADEKAKIGDLLYSLDDSVIGGVDSPIEFIPFHTENIWIVKHDGEFHHIEPVTPQNKNLPWEELDNGTQIQNVYCINVYALLADDPSIPVIIPFKSTSLKAGKQVTTQMHLLNRQAGKVPPAKVMELASTKTKNDKGTYAVLSCRATRDTSAEEIGMCLNWYKSVNSGTAKADNSDLESPTERAAQGSGDF